MIIYPLSKIYSDNLKHPYPVSGAGGGVKPSGGPDYLYIESSVSQQVTIRRDSSGYVYGSDIEYSFDKVNWTSIGMVQNYNFNCEANQKVYFRSSTGWGDPTNANRTIKFLFTGGSVHIGGKIKTIIDYTREDLAIIPANSFKQTFTSQYITSVDENIFDGLNEVESKGCNLMFSGSSITSAPLLPMRKLNNNCYQQMFSNCANLSGSITLPAETLTDSCYRQMLMYTNVNDIYCYASEGILSQYAFDNWLVGNTIATGTIHIHQASENDFTTAGVLPAGWSYVYL